MLSCRSDGLLCLLALCQQMGLLKGSERDACINRLCRRKLCLHEFHIKATYTIVAMSAMFAPPASSLIAGQA